MTTKDLSAPLLRIDSALCLRELADELLLAFPGAKHFEGDLQPVGPTIEFPRGTVERPRVTWDASCDALRATLRDSSQREITAAVTLKLVQPPHELDLQFANAYARVFNEDINVAPSILRDGELWETLRLSRVARAIARLTAFSTTPFLKWLTVVEAATHLTYEGMPFRPIVLMSKQSAWISDPAGDGYVSFKPPMPFVDALLEEKWIRAIAGSGRVALHGLGHPGNIVGIVKLASRGGQLNTLLPTPLESVASLVRPGTMAFVCAPNDDLYILLPSGAVFVKSQGRWRYQNFASFQDLLTSHLLGSIARPLLSILLDLSYARKGALFAIPSDLTVIGDLVPDHARPNRSNVLLRSALNGIKVDSESTREILMAAAAVDGAIVLSRYGVVRDVACLIGEPTSALLAKAKQYGLARFPGARSTAAWNASISGLGIKVSDDGPITAYLHGDLIAQFG